MKDKRTKEKRQLDKGIQKHKDEIIEFTLISDDLGVLDLKTTAGDLFANLTLVFLDPAVKKNMTIGKMYSYASSEFAGECQPIAKYMFRAGIDITSKELFQLDSTKEYEHDQIYAFPVDALERWIQQPEERTVTHCWEVEKDFDMEELADFIETNPSPEELEAYLKEHGAKPHTEED